MISIPEFKRDMWEISLRGAQRQFWKLNKKQKKKMWANQNIKKIVGMVNICEQTWMFSRKNIGYPEIPKKGWKVSYIYPSKIRISTTVQLKIRFRRGHRFQMPSELFALSSETPNERYFKIKPRVTAHRFLGFFIDLFGSNSELLKEYLTTGIIDNGSLGPKCPWPKEFCLVYFAEDNTVGSFCLKCTEPWRCDHSDFVVGIEISPGSDIVLDCPEFLLEDSYGKFLIKKPKY